MRGEGGEGGGGERRAEDGRRGGAQGRGREKRGAGGRGAGGGGRRAGGAGRGGATGVARNGSEATERARRSVEEGVPLPPPFVASQRTARSTFRFGKLTHTREAMARLRCRYKRCSRAVGRLDASRDGRGGARVSRGGEMQRAEAEPRAAVGQVAPQGAPGAHRARQSDRGIAPRTVVSHCDGDATKWVCGARLLSVWTSSLCGQRRSPERGSARGEERRLRAPRTDAAAGERPPSPPLPPAPRRETCPSPPSLPPSLPAGADAARREPRSHHRDPWTAIVRGSRLSSCPAAIAHARCALGCRKGRLGSRSQPTCAGAAAKTSPRDGPPAQWTYETRSTRAVRATGARRPTSPPAPRRWSSGRYGWSGFGACFQERRTLHSRGRRDSRSRPFSFAQKTRPEVSLFDVSTLRAPRCLFTLHPDASTSPLGACCPRLLSSALCAPRAGDTQSPRRALRFVTSRFWVTLDGTTEDVLAIRASERPAHASGNPCAGRPIGVR